MKIKLLSLILLIGLISTPLAYGAEVTGSIGSAGINQQVTPPAVPTGVLAVANGGTAVNLTWNTVSEATGYQVFRNTIDANWSSVSVLATPSTNSYSDTGLSGGVYYYKVKALNGSVASDFSDKSSVSIDGASVSSSGSSGGGGGGGSSGGGGGGGGGGTVITTTVTPTTTTLSVAVKKYDIDGDDKIGLKDLNNILFSWGTTYGILDLNTLLFNWSA